MNTEVQWSHWTEGWIFPSLLPVICGGSVYFVAAAEQRSDMLLHRNKCCDIHRFIFKFLTLIGLSLFVSMVKIINITFSSILVLCLD